MGLFETATAATMCRSKMSPLTYHTPPAIEVAKTKIAAMDQFRSFQIQDSMDGLGSNLLTWSISSLSSPIFFRIPADRKSTRLNSSHTVISYAVFCLTKNYN